MTRRLHITALTGNGMTTEYRALATPHMGSAPWVPETVQAAARVLLDWWENVDQDSPDLEDALAVVNIMGDTQEEVDRWHNALRALAQEDGE